MRITIDAGDLARIRRDFSQFSDRRFESAVAEALNGVAFSVRRAWVQDLGASLERPTGLTRRSPLVERADVGRLTAVVYIDPKAPGGDGIPPEEYVGTQETGSADRRLKKFERALQSSGAMPSGHKVVPGKHARLDGYGNISRGQIVQVLNQLGGALSAGYQRVIGRTQGKRKASAARAGRSYVAIPQPQGGLQPGIYQRVDRLLLPVFFFAPRTQYRRRLHLEAGADRVVSAELTPRLERALARRLATLEARA